MRDYIILNGISSKSISGLLIQNLPPISKPAQRVEVEEIDGRDGDIVTYLGYKAYDKEFKIGLYGNYDIDKVIAYFNSQGTVIFSNEDDKYYNYLTTDKNGKGKILSGLGFDETNKSQFEKQICEKVSQNYIYNLEYLAEYEVYKFNICIELPQKDGGVKKAIAGFKYFCDSGELFLITFF